MSASSTQTAEDIMKAINQGNMEDAQLLQPGIISNFNIDPTKVAEWWAGHLNDSWAPKVNQKIQEGFITVRVQTEFSSPFGHTTMIYMAKMKP